MRGFGRISLGGSALCLLMLLGGCSGENALSQALDERKKEPRETAAVISTDVVLNFVPVGMIEEEAISLILAAGFKEITRTGKNSRVGRTPEDPEYYIYYRQRKYEWWLINYYDYRIEIGVSNSHVNEMHSSIQFYMLGTI